MKKTLYYKDAGQNIRQYTLYQDGTTLVSEYGVLGGESVVATEEIPHGLAGRSKQEQMELRMNSKINKKMDKGYVFDIEVAKSGKALNMLGLEKPMLAARFDKIKNFDFSKVYVQNKFDGHRCLIKNESGELVAYSRNGKPIDSIPEILSEIKMPEGHTIDGELYHHGTPLQTISSWIKRRQDNSKKLSFICYDAILKESYDERYRFIKEIDLGAKSCVAHTELIRGEFNPKPILENAIKHGYEGLILRPDGFDYEDGKRSKGLIKVKKFFDDEFEVVDILASVDGWARLKCITNKGKVFMMSAPGNMEEKTRILKNKNLYIGKMVQGEYAGLTKDGIPFHPIATMWRNKQAE